VATTTSRTGNDTSVYEIENFRWDEPETVVHQPPFQVPAGGGFRFTCDWMNVLDEAVGFNLRCHFHLLEAPPG
jgi:hypothetical protein